MMNSRLGKLDIYPFWRPQTLLEAEAAVRVMPGGCMAQRDPVTGKNPGDPYIRAALVHDRNFAEDARTRIANVLNG